MHSSSTQPEGRKPKVPNDKDIGSCKSRLIISAQWLVTSKGLSKTGIAWGGGVKCSVTAIVVRLLQLRSAARVSSTKTGWGRLVSSRRLGLLRSRGEADQITGTEE